MPRTMELGKLVDALTATYLACNRDWVQFVSKVRNRPCLHHLVQNLPHPAAKYLGHLRNIGAPIQCLTPDWTLSRRDDAAQRGSHQSARHYIAFSESEMADMIRKGYWVVLPYSVVKDLPNLRLSPMGVVPQRERRPRTIVDYSFSGINHEAARGAPPEAMQFGKALSRILQRILAANPRHGPTYMLKLDLSDGFYRVRLRAEDIPTLGVAFPVGPGEDPLVALPLTLPMGWTESPPYFCSATETAVDLINLHAAHSWDPPRHPLEPAAGTQPPQNGRHCITVPTPTFAAPPRITVPPRLPPAQRRHHRRPLAYGDVFVDDEILLAQGTPHQLHRFKRQALHINDWIFRANDRRDNPTGHKEPISESKLLKGDACWSTTKVILGWTLDTLRGTIELPAHRKTRLRDILTAALLRKRVSVQSWQKLLGELRSMVMGIPGGQGLFSQLQVALQRRAHHRVRIHKEAKACLQDFYTLAQDLVQRPTRMAEIVPTHPLYAGCCDASRAGMGGVWLPSLDPYYPQHPPYVWRTPFPPQVQRELITTTNPSGTITNSDLELAGTIAHAGALAHHRDIRECTVAIFSDNTPAVVWGTKASTTTTGPAAYLLRTASLHQRRHRYLLQHAYIPGPANVLADIASRRFDLSDDALLHRLTALSPHAQNWQMLTTSPELVSQLTCDLLRTRPDRPYLRNAPAPSTFSGQNTGCRTRNRWAWTPSYPLWRTKSLTSESSRTASVPVPPAAVVSRSGLHAYVTKSSPLRRGSPTWVTPTRASRLLDSWTRGSHVCIPPTHTRTQHHTA